MPLRPMYFNQLWLADKKFEGMFAMAVLKCRMTNGHRMLHRCMLIKVRSKNND